MIFFVIRSNCGSSIPSAPLSVFWLSLDMERVSSAVERWTRNLLSPGSNPLCYRFEDWAFSFSPLTSQLTQLFKCVPGRLAIDSSGNVSDLVFARNSSVARINYASQRGRVGVGMNRSARGGDKCGGL